MPLALLRFFFSSRRRHTRFDCDWSSDVCSSDLKGSRLMIQAGPAQEAPETDLLNPDPAKISRLQPESEAARNAWLANLKQELVAPVTAIREISEMMLKDAVDRGPADFPGDVERIQKAGERLVTLVHEVLDPCGMESVELS